MTALTPAQQATVTFADHLLNAPPEWIQAEPTDCLLELIEVGIEHLSAFCAVGNGARIIDLELLKDRVKSKLDLTLNQGNLL